MRFPTSSPVAGRSRLRWAPALFAGLLFLTSAACGSDDDDSDSSSDPAADPADGGEVTAPDAMTVVMGGGPDIIYASLLVALNNQFPELTDEYGTEFEVATTSGGAESLAALTGGGSNVLAGVDPTAATNAFASGEEITGVFNMLVGHGIVFVGRAELEDELGTDVAKFADSTWGYAAPSGSAYATTVALAEENGLDFADLDQLGTGDFAAMLPALQAGQVDIVGMSTGGAAVAVDQGVGYIVASSHDPEFQETIPGGHKIGSFLALRDDFIDEYPEFTQLLVDALVEARLELQDASGDEVRALLSPDVQELTEPGVFAAAWDLAKSSLVDSSDGSFTEAQIDDTLEQLVAGETIEAPEDGEALYDNTYVDRAYEELDVTRPSIG